MKIVRGDWVVPVDAPPIPNGAVVLDRGAIVDVGPFPAMAARWEDEVRGAHGEAGFVAADRAVVLPALVNAHTHLELSWMAAAPPPCGDFARWVRAMIERREPSPGEVSGPIERAIGAIASSGTAAIGDVGNTAAAFEPLRRSPLEGRFFYEVIGWGARGLACYDEAVRALDSASSRAHGAASASTDTPPSLRVSTTAGGAASLSMATPFPASISPHGPHSVSPEVLTRIAIRALERGDVVAVHLAESRDEDALLRRGEGPLRALLHRIGALPDGWEPPRLSPAGVLDRAGLLGPRTLAVHGVHLSREDARLLAERGVTVVLCPRSNAWTGAGVAPVAMLVEEGVRLALGTDSLASNEDLDLFAELTVLRRLAPGVPPEVLLRAASLGGAEALGLSAALGSITPGKEARLIAVRLRDEAVRESGRVASGGATPGADAEPYRTIFSGPAPGDVNVVPV